MLIFCQRDTELRMRLRHNAFCGEEREAPVSCSPISEILLKCVGLRASERIAVYTLCCLSGGRLQPGDSDVVARQRSRHLHRLLRETHAYSQQLLHRQSRCLRRHSDVTLHVGAPRRGPHTRLDAGRLLLQVQQLCAR